MIPAHRRMMLCSAPPAAARVQVLGWDKVADTYAPCTLWLSQEWRPLA